MFVTCCMQEEAGSGAAHDELQQQLLAAREEVAQLQTERAAAELPAPPLSARPQKGANTASVLQAEGQQQGLSGSVSAMPAVAVMESPSLSSQMGSAAHGSAAEWLTPIRGAASMEDIDEVSVWSKAAPEAASADSDSYASPQDLDVKLLLYSLADGKSQSSALPHGLSSCCRSSAATCNQLGGMPAARQRPAGALSLPTCR